MIPVDQFIREICLSIDDNDRRYYNKIISSMARGFRDLNLTSVPSYKTIDVNLNELNMIDWPSDCIFPLYVGVGRSGIVYNLSEDKSLTDRNAFQAVNFTAQDPGFINPTLLPITFPNYYGVFSTTGELFGISSPYNPIGVYNHLQAIRQTVVSGGFIPTDIFILTYKYDATSVGLQFIPTEFEMALRSFILYEFYLRKDKSLSDRMKGEYRQQATRLRNFYNSFSDGDLQDIMTQNYKSSPK